MKSDVTGGGLAESRATKRAVAQELVRTSQVLSPVSIASRMWSRNFRVSQQRSLVTEVALACDLLVLSGLVEKCDSGYRATPRLRGRLVKDRRPKQRNSVSQVKAQVKAGQSLILAASVTTLVSGCVALGTDAGDRAPAYRLSRVPAGVAQRPLIGQVTIRQQPQFSYCGVNCPARTVKTATSQGSLRVAQADEPRPIRMAAHSEVPVNVGLPPAVAGVASLEAPRQPRAAMTTAVVPMVEPNGSQVTTTVAKHASGQIELGQAIAVPVATEREHVGDGRANGAAPRNPVEMAPLGEDIVAFAHGSATLGKRGQGDVDLLLDKARSAEVIWLRGYVASSRLGDDMKRLAVGRSVAVREALVAKGIERTKIRILAPRKEWLDKNPNAAVNRSVQVRFV